MSIGMTYDQYWYGDVWMVRIFKDAYERHREQHNYESWLQGMYFYNAVGAALGAAFAKKGSKTPKYMNTPIPITEREKKQEHIRKIKHTLDFIAKGK